MRRRITKALLVILLAGIVPLPEVAKAESAQHSTFLSEKEYLNLPEDKIDIAEGALIIAKGYYPELNIQKYLNQIDAMAKELKVELKGIKQPSEIVNIINRHLFVKKEFGYNKPRRFLNDVLDDKSADCFGFSFLYLSLAQRARLPCYGVIARKHMFVRYDDKGVVINVETTLKGKSFPNQYFIRSLNIPLGSIEQGIYLVNLSKKHTLAVALNNRGATYYDNGDYYRAAQDFSKVISLYPKYLGAYLNRATAYFDLGDYDKSMGDCNKAISLDPREPQAYNNRGNVYSRNKDYERVLQDYNKARSLDPEFVNAYVNLGNVYLKQEKPDRAIVNYNKAIFVNPKEADAYFYRGGAYSQKGDDVSAIDDFTKAISLNPHNQKAYFYRGQSHLMKGDIDRAIYDYGMAIAVDKKYAQAYHWRALAYGYKQDKLNMLRDLRKAFALDPTLKNETKKNKVFRDLFSPWWQDKDFKKLIE